MMFRKNLVVNVVNISEKDCWDFLWTQENIVTCGFDSSFFFIRSGRMILKLGLLNSLLFWNQALLPPFTVEKALKGSVGSASDKKRKAEDSKGQALFVEPLPPPWEPGWWFGTFGLFFHIYSMYIYIYIYIGNFIIPTDKLTPSFFRGVGSTGIGTTGGCPRLIQSWFWTGFSSGKFTGKPHQMI